MKYTLPLSLNHQTRLYWELSQQGAFATGEKKSWPYQKMTLHHLLILAILQSRYDPRLMSLLVDFFIRKNLDLNPVTFKKDLEAQKALTIAAVIGEFVTEQKKSNEDLFRYLMSEAKPVPTQLFYKNLYRIGGQKMAEVLDKPLWYFKKWGYLATDIPILKETPLQHRAYQYDLTSRGFILQKYCQSHRSFQMKDYLNLTEHSISRQQALKDLQNFSWLRKKGKGKGSVYYSLLK